MRIFLVAGEPSGDRLGAALMEGLRTLEPGVRFSGVAGPLMQAQGMRSLFPMEELSVMGIAEVLPRYFHLKRRIREVAEAVIASEAKALITIDSPDFGLRVAALVKAARPEMRTIHTSRLRSGHGGRGGRQRWRGMWIMCWRCCPLSRPT
jgi:lipid-A-disaccharide synthase